MSRIDPQGRDPREPSRWKLGGAAPILGCLAIIIIIAALLAAAALLWWLA